MIIDEPVCQFVPSTSASLDFRVRCPVTLLCLGNRKSLHHCHRGLDLLENDLLDYVTFGNHRYGFAHKFSKLDPIFVQPLILHKNGRNGERWQSHPTFMEQTDPTYCLVKRNSPPPRSRIGLR